MKITEIGQKMLLSILMCDKVIKKGSIVKHAIKREWRTKIYEMP